MIRISRRATAAQHCDAVLLMNFELRSKSRLRTTTTSGEEVGLFLEAGRPLQDGELLLSDDGRCIRVQAAEEPLLHVECSSPLELCRAAYHLGNRHVHLEVGDGWLRLLDDDVLAHMLHQMGARTIRLSAPFNPESGAYGGGHHHSHGKDAVFQYAPRLHQYGREA
jgi:urease accessory protein